MQGGYLLVFPGVEQQVDRLKQQVGQEKFFKNHPGAFGRIAGPGNEHKGRHVKGIEQKIKRVSPTELQRFP